MLAFLGSMIWMDLAADEVVAITVALGTIFNIDSSLASVRASIPLSIHKLPMLKDHELYPSARQTA